MITLGIHNSGITSSAAILDGNKLIVASSEERFSRKKYQRGFPHSAAEFCLKERGIDWNDLDCIAVGWNPALNLAARYQGRFSERAKFPGDWFYSVANQVLSKMEVSNLGTTIQEFRVNNRKLRIHFVNHHDAHAAKAFLMSPFDSAAIFTADHYGEIATTTWKSATLNGMDTVKEIYFPQSIGALYSAFTEYLGYRPQKDEWKIMGLSAYGKSTVYLEKFKKVVDRMPDGEFKMDLSYFNHYSFETGGLYSKRLVELFGPPRKRNDEITERHSDIAAGLQHITEEIVFHCLDFLFERTKNKNLCLSGGCMMNSVLNGKILSRLPFRNLYIPFSPDDTGNSIGAALFVNWFSSKEKYTFDCLEGSFLGPSWSDEQVEEALKKYKVTYKKLDKPTAKAAELISEGKIIGWFQGRMEFGARALGNRSILADPRRKDMKDRINSAVKYRESFRPFAPSILIERVKEYFILPDKELEVPFMEQAYKVKRYKRTIIPAVVHNDGTGRLQTVKREANLLFYALIMEFDKITGVPVVLNTSFNLKGEPIVCSPEDALRTFATSGMDALIINSFLMKKRSI